MARTASSFALSALTTAWRSPSAGPRELGMGGGAPSVNRSRHDCWTVRESGQLVRIVYGCAARRSRCLEGAPAALNRCALSSWILISSSSAQSVSWSSASEAASSRRISVTERVRNAARIKRRDCSRKRSSSDRPASVSATITIRPSVSDRSRRTSPRASNLATMRVAAGWPIPSCQARSVMRIGPNASVNTALRMALGRELPSVRYSTRDRYETLRGRLFTSASSRAGSCAGVGPDAWAFSATPSPAVVSSRREEPLEVTGGMDGSRINREPGGGLCGHDDADRA